MLSETCFPTFPSLNQVQVCQAKHFDQVALHFDRPAFLCTVCSFYNQIGPNYVKHTVLFSCWGSKSVQRKEEITKLKDHLKGEQETFIV